MRDEIQQPRRKRQRRLTTHHGGAGGGGPPAPVLDKHLKSDAGIFEHAKAHGKSIHYTKKSAAAAALAVAAPHQQLSTAANGDDDVSPPKNVASYQTAGPSLKVAPGKRIKWRGAIDEEDIIRQDLSQRFALLATSSY